MSVRPHSKKKRPVKKSTLRNKADALFSKIIRAKGFCERCGATDRLQTSHFISRRYLAVRWNLLNAECLCVRCHKFFTERPLEAAAHAVLVLGVYPYAELVRLAVAGGVPDYRAVIADLTERLKGAA